MADQHLEYRWQNKRLRSVWQTRMVPCSAWVGGRVRRQGGRTDSAGKERGNAVGTLGVTCRDTLHTHTHDFESVWMIYLDPIPGLC
jgi:hypothetical protein